MVEIIKGDIRHFKGDYVVNPSNTILQLGSGVSGVLRRMCPSLQNEMNKYIEKHGFLNPGDIAITVYPCDEYKYTIHAAVMDYRKGAIQTMPDYERIGKICKNIINAVDKGLVVTPLLGTGVGGLDKAKVLEIMKTYFQNSSAKFIMVIR
jgi:O-acetyl-ADP-ribose deacetylase (regulator of RNase III)